MTTRRTNHALHGLLLALLAPLLLCAGCARRPERPNVLLVVVDTWRADRFSALGRAPQGRTTTPRLDELAREGLVFERVQSPRAKTTPAVASLLSGLYPHDHGVRDLTTPVSSRVPLLAEHLRRHGYRTGAIVGNYVLQDRFCGLARGFDVWVEDLPEAMGVPPDDVPQRTARSLTDGALVALGLADGPTPDGAGPRAPFTRPQKPWFLYLHYMDPHGLYDPPEEHRVFHRAEPDWIDAHAPDPDHARVVAEYNVPALARADGRIDAARVRDLYDGEVRYADAEIGRLVDALRASGQLADTVVVVTADHGESLGEHDYWFEHGRYAYEATCRVPLLVRLPESLEGRPAPGRRGGDLSLVELAPTLLELCGLPQLPPPPAAGGEDRRRFHGRSRAQLLARDAAEPGAVFCEKIERTDKSGAVQTKAVRLGDWKLLRRYTHVSEPSGERRLLVLGEELYDLARDPAETRSLLPAAPPEAPLDRLRLELFAFASADVHFEDLAQLLQRRREELRRTDPDALRKLEALGY